MVRPDFDQWWAGWGGFGLPVPVFRSSNLTLARPPFGSVGRIKSETQEHHIMAFRALACRLHTPAISVPRLPLALALYRALRPLAGPVRAYRVAFGRRAEQ